MFQRGMRATRVHIGTRTENIGKSETMATEYALNAAQIADRIEATDVEAFAWLLGLEFAHDAEAVEAKQIIIDALRAYTPKKRSLGRE